MKNSTQTRSLSSPNLQIFGRVYAVLAYSSWGLLPIYWKFLGQIPAVEVLSHRILWSTVFLSGLLFLQKPRPDLTQLWRSPKQLSILLTTAALLAFNWGVYIYGVNTDRVVETSLGYYINPLMNVLLGYVFLQERLHWSQGIAVILASIGVAYFVWQFGAVPWIALGLAFSFALYGLLRKIIQVSPMLGLGVETLLITPVALVLVIYWEATGVGHFGSTWSITLLFIGAGVITSLPLLWFNKAAKQLRLSTLGFFQYLGPTFALLLGVFLYHEPFTPTHAITFGFIWSALILFSSTSLMLRPTR